MMVTQLAASSPIPRRPPKSPVSTENYLFKILLSSTKVSFFPLKIEIWGQIRVYRVDPISTFLVENPETLRKKLLIRKKKKQENCFFRASLSSSRKPLWAQPTFFAWVGKIISHKLSAQHTKFQGNPSSLSEAVTFFLSLPLDVKRLRRDVRYR